MKDLKNMSIAEYFAHRGLKEAKRIEVTNEDGTKVALNGQVALMWWRMVHILWKDNMSDQDEEVYKFRSVDENGNTTPLTLKEMIGIHDWGTVFCSLPGHMRNISPTYKDIVALGEKALPTIFEYLRDNESGMNIILLLEDITKSSPYKGEKVTKTFVAYTVKDCVAEWLKWGKKNKYIK